MVLEGATSPPPNDGFSNNDNFDANPDPSPPSQSDPNNPRDSLLFEADGVRLDLRSVNFEGMQRPWVASWTKRANERWLQQIYREVPPLVADLQKQLPRSLDNDELQAISGHMVRYLALKENVNEIAVDVGIFVAVSVMRSMTRRKDPRSTLLKALRIGSFGALTALGIRMAGGLTLAPYVSTAMMQDKRLVYFNRDLKHSLMENKQADRQPRAGPSSRERWQTPSRPQRVEHQDDASPASGPYPDYNPVTSSTDAQTSSWNAPESREPQRPAQQQEEPFDDASPSQQPPPPDDSTPSESTWDRVRRLANEQSQNPPPASSQDSWGRPPVGQRGRNDGSSSSGSGDSFTFSTADEERQLAKSEAQKEFDARIERERQGRDFDEKKR